MVETTAPYSDTGKGLTKLQEILNSIGTTSGDKKSMLKVDAAPGSNLEKVLVDIKKVMTLQAGYLSKIVDYQNEQRQKERLGSASGASPEKLQPGGDVKQPSMIRSALRDSWDFVKSWSSNLFKLLGIPIIAELFGKFTPLIIGLISQLPRIANLLINSISLIGKSIGLISSVVRSIPGIVSRLASFSLQLYNAAKFAVTAITDASKLAANTIVNALRPTLAPLATALAELGAGGVGLLAGGAAATWAAAGGLPILLQKYVFARSKEEAANTTNTITPANDATKQDINDMINYQLRQNPIDSSQSLDDIFSTIKGSISDQTGGMLTSGKIGQLELNTLILQKAREVKGDPNAQLSPELDKLSDYVSSVPLSTRKSAPRYTFPEGATGLGFTLPTYTFPEGATGLKSSTFVAPFSNQLTDPNRLRLNRSGAPSVIMVPTPGRADRDQQGSVTSITNNVYQTKDPAVSLGSQMPGGGISDIPIFNWGY